MFLPSEGPTDECSSDSGSDIGEFSGDCEEYSDFEEELPRSGPCCGRARDVQNIMSFIVLDRAPMQEAVKELDRLKAAPLAEEDVALHRLCGRLASVFSNAAADPDEW